MLWMIFSRGLKIGYIDCQGMQTCYKVNFGEVFKKEKKVEPHDKIVDGEFFSYQTLLSQNFPFWQIQL